MRPRARNDRAFPVILVVLVLVLLPHPATTAAVSDNGGTISSPYFGFWGDDNRTAAFTNLSWDPAPTNDTLAQMPVGGPRRYLFPSWRYFCQEQVVYAKCTLFPDYQRRWDEAVPFLARLLQEQKILGFLTGGERVSHNTSCSTWSILANTVRKSFPVSTGAVIYANEGISTFQDKLCDVPAAYDWISMDYFRADARTGYIAGLRKLYETVLYPRLAPHQQVVILPQTGQVLDVGVVCNDTCTADLELQDAHDAVQWSQDDGRVAMLAPYAWSRGGAEKGLVEMAAEGGGASAKLLAFWKNYGLSKRHTRDWRGK